MSSSSCSRGGVLLLPSSHSWSGDPNAYPDGKPRKKSSFVFSIPNDETLAERFITISFDEQSGFNVQRVIGAFMWQHTSNEATVEIAEYDPPAQFEVCAHKLPLGCSSFALCATLYNV